MITKKVLYLLCIALFFMNFSCRENNLKSSDYDSLIEQGHKKITDIKKIESRFDSVSYIVNLGHPVAPEQWQTIFFISGWYQCLYVQEFEVKNKTFILKGSPQLRVLEVIEVEGRSINFGKQVMLHGSELTKFLESGFDLKSIGFSPTEKKAPPPRDFMKYYHEIHP